MPAFLINTLPNDNILDWSKLKAFTKLKMVQMSESFLERVENIVGKGENAVYQHFLFFSHCFHRVSFKGSLKLAIAW